jgi:hypothetical protein
LSFRPVVHTTSVQHQTRGLREDNDARTGMPTGIPVGAMCVQRFDDSRKFCNSHYLSHFAAFFIDARTKRSVVESFVFDFNQVNSDDMVWYKSLWLGRRRTLSRDGPRRPRLVGRDRSAEATTRYNRQRVGRSGSSDETLTR